MQRSVTWRCSTPAFPDDVSTKRGLCYGANLLLCFVCSEFLRVQRTARVPRLCSLLVYRNRHLSATRVRPTPSEAQHPPERFHPHPVREYSKGWGESRPQVTFHVHLVCE